MVPTITTEGTGAANGAATATTIPPASHDTPHGKDSNGSIVTPRARPQYVRRGEADADTEANKDGIDAGSVVAAGHANAHANTNAEGFMSSTALLYKQKWEQAQLTIAHTRGLLKKYGAIEDHDSNFLEKAFADLDPGNNNNNNTVQLQPMELEPSPLQPLSMDLMAPGTPSL